MELNALLAAPAVLPSLPRVVALLIAELARDEPNLRCVNQLVGADPALAARVLACANGPEFESHRQIAGIPEA
nr:HDOD domain-containing protein [Giesbergeria sp.]